MPRIRWVGWWLCTLVTASLVLCLWGQSVRPMHTDEACNAVSVGEALEGTPFVFEVRDRHGPTWFAGAELVARCCGATGLRSLETWQVRLPSALAWVALILTLPWWARTLGWPAALVAGGWWACAAPMVYYGGYAIHEPLLALLVSGCWQIGDRWVEAQSRTDRWTAVVLLALLIATAAATKETVLISVLAAGIAVAAATPLQSWTGILRQRGIEIVGGFCLMLAVIGLWYSAGGTHPERLADLLQVLPRLGERATGEGHQHPWNTYASWLLLPHARNLPWSSWALIIGFIPGACVAWSHRRQSLLPWTLSIVVVATAVIYIAIPYKTPWLMLQVLVPAALIAGMGWIHLARCLPRPLAVVAGLLVLCGLLSETRQLVFRWPADPANPLAYAHTVPDCERLGERVMRELREHPGTVAVVASDPWPLPWYLRRCSPVGYWPDATAAATVLPQCRLVITAGDVPVPSGSWSTLDFGIRPDVLMQLHVRTGDP